ncbi:hypothetical protein PGTUg99_010777 [Puccinia graminis f. sp. tritici]|uniref:Uncharacterized protein n=1 Tax=Puccinia graminis f. sp. tritici TaxID=56615 RepID=A0A5B0R7S7_PUCGR|nr:hypothetical protein PGTUg99_010777 [Puccinia graminis f. sp. tritici]
MSPNTVYRDRIVFPIQSRFIRRLGSAGAIRYEPRGNLVSVLPKPILDCGPPTLFGPVGLGLDRTPPGLPHSSLKFPACPCPPLCLKSEDPPPLVASFVEVPGLPLPSASPLSNLRTPPPLVASLLGLDRTPPGLPDSSFPACPPLRLWILNLAIPPLIASPIKRRVGLGLERTPPALPHSSFPVCCPPLRRCFAGRSAAAAAVVALGVVGSRGFDVWSRTNTIVEGYRLPISGLITAATDIAWSWSPPPTTFFSFSRCARQLVRA